VPYYNNRLTKEALDGYYTTVDDPSYIAYRGFGLRRGSVETGFRTRPPSEGIVTTIPNSVADPYTVFQDLQTWKQRIAVNSGFDASAFRMDRGHPWDLMKYEMSGDPWSFTSKGGRRYINARPQMFPAGIDTGFDLAIPRTDLSSYGAIQYGSASPLSDRFSFSAFTGELREGLPKFTSEIMRSRSKHIRGVGGDYLNAQFGWIPLLNDLRGIATALVNASYGLYQPAGATHRKRNERPTELIRSRTFSQDPVAIALGNYGDPSLLKDTKGTGVTTDSFLRADGSSTIRAYRKRWFEGEFVYIPEAGFDATKYEDRLTTLFKTDITPSDLWQLAPWSWLVDWTTDIGGALEAAEAATSDRILSTYAYAMESIEQEIIAVLYNIRGETGGYYAGPPRVVTTWKTTSYRRIRANPFGFTPNPSVNLSPGQLGILGALGLKKF